MDVVAEAEAMLLDGTSADIVVQQLDVKQSLLICYVPRMCRTGLTRRSTRCRRSRSGSALTDYTRRSRHALTTPDRLMINMLSLSSLIWLAMLSAVARVAATGPSSAATRRCAGALACQSWTRAL